MTEAPPRRGYRADLQGLRTVAVLLVLVYHLSPARLPGGFVGVDVFFVLSGFLITRMLAGEQDASGSIRFGRFALGRMRRLFPAAAIVLAASLVATVLVLPATRWLDTAWHVLASAVQVENWALTLDTTDYLNPTTGPVITQHFWSLSIEWQMYALWVGLFALGLIAPRQGRRRFSLVAIVAVTVLSFATSVVVGALDPGAGYFLTPTRIWEFGAGAIVASVAWRPAGRAARELAGWSGLVAILVTAVAMPAVAFPAWVAAVPVLGAAALLLIGDPARPTSLERVLGLRPMVVGGDLSYAIYLWHWPVLLVFLAVTERSAPGIPGSLLIVGLTVALAGLTIRFAERPIRGGAANRRVVIALIAAGTAPLVFAGLVFGYVAQGRQQLSEAGDLRHPGALALNPGLAGFVDPAPLVPDPSVAFDDLGPIGPGNHCMLSRDVPIVCEFGDPAAERTMVVVGDSHAWQWLAVLDEFGRRAGWQVESLVRPSCPFAETGVDVPNVGDDGTCGTWRTAVMERLLETRPDVVVTAGLTPFGYEFSDYHVETPAGFVQGYVAAWDRLADAGIHVVALRDGPYFNGDMLECVAEHRGDQQACWAPRAEALDAHEDPLVEASMRAGVPLVDLSDGICGPVKCDAVVGNVVVYRDRQHLTATYTLTMLPLLSAGLREAGVAVVP
jgi:peptidoglycan/LPS O-acetylase OafA/YrhL